MGAYQQMGHQSENLLTHTDLAKYAGIVASPVNYPEDKLITHIKTARFRLNFDVVFDPQLYVPSTERGHLRTWSYFPSDVDTADLSSDTWWNTLVADIATTAARVGADAVCSPAIVPRVFSDEYFERVVRSGSDLRERLKNGYVRPLQTLLVGLAELGDYARTMTIASIATKSTCEEVYLVFVGDTSPRREFADPDALTGALQLISALHQAGTRVFVAFASSDVVLWKAAGAAHCGTGKFFNLRRFTRSRFDEPADGGGVLAYWFEESLLAFLRASDLQRVRKAGVVSAASESNPFAAEILAAIPNTKPWVGLAWRQYLYWFADIQARIDGGEVDVSRLLELAEANWTRLDEARPQVLMDERYNDGGWIRQWRRAVLEFPYPPQ